MDELINVRKDEAVTTSLKVAEHFNKRHTNVIRAIENILTDNTELKIELSEMFKKSLYTDTTGRKLPMYYMNRDGFTLLAMGFTGKRATEWKIQYINAFNSMESILSEKRTEAWVETRKYGKLTRKAETDMINQLVEYAKSQGSTHSYMLYTAYSKLADKILGITDRDIATIRQLNNLELIERIILHEIESGMIEGLDYHDIYKSCKKAVEHFGEFARLNVPLQKEVIKCQG